MGERARGEPARRPPRGDDHRVLREHVARAAPRRIQCRVPRHRNHRRNARAAGRPAARLCRRRDPARVGPLSRARIVPYLDPELWPVCSPRLLDPARPIAAPADCLSYPLLQDADRADWALWLRAQGIEDLARARRELQRGCVADQGGGCRAGRGAGARHLCAGRSRGRPAGARARTALPTELSYYVVCSEARQHEWKIAAFRDWLASEIGGDDDGDGPRDLLA